MANLARPDSPQNRVPLGIGLAYASRRQFQLSQTVPCRSGDRSHPVRAAVLAILIDVTDLLPEIPGPP